MGDSSTIEWTEATWNPVVGCSIASPGCDNCYAARQAAGRLASTPAYKGLSVRNADGVPTFTGEVRCLPERLGQPLKWKRPRRIFVNSMSDLFHPQVLGARHVDRFGADHPFLAEVVATMVRSPQHTYQVLTKRPQLMARVLRHPMFKLDVNACLMRDCHPVMPGGMSEPDTPWPSNIWLGASIESDPYSWRADHVRATPGAVRFLSLEPLLGPLPSLDLTGIDWVIVGGESGPRARPMHPQWVRDIRDQCVAAGVPFFFKQWGEYGPAGVWGGPDHHVLINGQLMQPGERLGMDHMMQPAALHRWGKKQAGRTLDGRTWDEYPA